MGSRQRSPCIAGLNRLAVVATLGLSLVAKTAGASQASPPTATTGLDPLVARVGPNDVQELYLEVFHGDRSTGLLSHVRLSNGRLSLRDADLRTIGLVAPPGASVDADGLISLDALPGLTYRYEAATQRLILHAPPALHPVQRLGYQRPGPVQVRRDAGWLLGYDTYARGTGDEHTIALGNSLRWFGRAGALEIGTVSRTGGKAIGVRRLDTRWSYSDPTRLWTWTAGDLITGGTAWSRPVRLGGVQWRRNFGVRPDLITLPMPRFSADATVPSTVELYVNNVRQFGSNVQAGPFVLDTLPRISGAGQATLVVTDALGRVTQTSVPLYVDYQRLAKGLSDFTVETGVLRPDFAGLHDTYGRNPIASASWRRGLTDTFTFEGHGEAGPGVRLAGVGAVWAPGNRWGLVNASYARSAGDGDGGQYAIGYQRGAARYGLDLQALRRDEGFRDLGDTRVIAEGAGASFRSQDRGTFWVPIGRGNLAVTWLGWRDQGERRHRTRSLSWTQNIGPHLSVSASVFDDRNSGGGGGITVSVPLGDRRHANVSVQRIQDRTSVSATLAQRAPLEGGWGWSVQGGDAQGQNAKVAAEVRGRYVEAWFGVDRTAGRTGTFFQAAGSVAVMDGRFLLSRRIDDAFAVVSTEGVAGVPILSENRLYGRTDEAGYLLISELRGWQRNRLAVDVEHMGPRFRLPSIEQMATPADRSGALVRFAIVRTSPAVIVLMGPAGALVPPGSRGRVAGSGQDVIVGYDGEAYLEDIAKGAVIELKVGGVECRYRVPPPADTELATPVRRGPLPCERLRP